MESYKNQYSGVFEVSIGVQTYADASRGNFRLQREGPKNILDRLFLAVGCYNFLLKPYLENF